MSESTHTDPSIQSGSYALGALDPDEVVAFERHLADNEETRAEVTGLADTAVLLGLAVAPVDPPAHLKANLMALLDATPQLPGEVDTDPGAEPTPGPAERRARARWASRPVTALVGAAAVIGILAGGGVAATTIVQKQAQQEQADMLAAINAAPDAQRVTVDMDGGSATLVWSGELLASALITDALGPLPAGKVYELWYIGESGPRPAGTFTAGDGRTWRVLDGQMQPGDLVGVTVEPRGGSDLPTTDPVLVIESA